MPEKAAICTSSTTTVPRMTKSESPDLTKELDMDKLWTWAKSFGKERTKEWLRIQN